VTTLSSLKTIAAATLLSAIAVTQVFAQPAISEPAAFQALHPYLDVLNGGAPTLAYWLQGNPRALQARSSKPERHRRPRSTQSFQSWWSLTA
jgi:hypothetical protein